MNSEETENQNEAIVIILVFLLLYLIPATIYFLYKLCCGSICSNSFEDEDETKKRKKKSTTSNYKCMLLNITIYVVLVGVFYAYLQKVEPVEDLRDPFEILADIDFGKPEADQKWGAQGSPRWNQNRLGWQP